MNKKNFFTCICLFLACFWVTQVFAKTPSILENKAIIGSTIVAQNNDDDVNLFEEIEFKWFNLFFDFFIDRMLYCKAVFSLNHYLISP